MGFLNKKDKKAFYSVIEKHGSITTTRGCCFKMLHTETPANPDYKKDTFLWVTSSSLLQDDGRKLFVSKPKEKDADILMDKTNLKSNQGVSFMTCSDECGRKLMKNKRYLTSGYSKFPSKCKLYACVQYNTTTCCVFAGKEIVELKLEKMEGNDCYKIDDNNCKKASLREITGAPIIIEVGTNRRNQVVGVLNVTSDLSLHPVFFTKDTFNIEINLNLGVMATSIPPPPHPPPPSSSSTSSSSEELATGDQDELHDIPKRGDTEMKKVESPRFWFFPPNLSHNQVILDSGDVVQALNKKWAGRDIEGDFAQVFKALNDYDSDSDNDNEEMKTRPT